MNEDSIIELESRHHANVYQKMPVVLERGDGASVWDIRGKEYIDCMGGYGVALVGHCNPKVVSAVKNQLEKLITCHGSLFNSARAALLEKLSKITPPGLDSIYLCNSGAEANECAIKLARKDTGKKEILAFTGSFHGKTMGAVSLTWGKKYREPFEPLLPGIKFARFGDLDSAKDAISEETAAVIVEPVQGESGIHVPPSGFLRALREICDEKDIRLIFDEIQTGFGRTGKMWAAEHWGTQPDILTVAKGMAGGLPIGATISTREVMSSLKVGEHTSTFGGNPLACAAGSATIDYIVENHLPSQAEEKGKRLRQGLEKIQRTHSAIREVRGLGLMIGVEIRFDVKNILDICLEKGVILLYSGRNIIRLLPPLVIREEQMQTALSIIGESLAVP